MESYFLDGRFYYYKPRYQEEWKVAKLVNQKFEIEVGLTVQIADLIDQCEEGNIIRIPCPEELR